MSHGTGQELPDLFAGDRQRTADQRCPSVPIGGLPRGAPSFGEDPTFVALRTFTQTFTQTFTRIAAAGGPSGIFDRPIRVERLVASVTLPMHVREDITPFDLAAGLMTAGTASGDVPWAEALIAARARGEILILLREAGGLSNDALLTRLRFVPEDPALPIPALIRTTVADPSTDPISTDRDDSGDEQIDSPLAMEALARAMDAPAAVTVERPTVPELTDEPLENVRRLFALKVSQLADLFGVTERQMHRYLRQGMPENRRQLADALVAVGLTVIGGLGPDGARWWLYSGDPSPTQLIKSGDIDALRARAEALRDSPVT